MKNCDVAIVGAGPYGLSIAAHLNAANVDLRIFGSPMGFWLQHMPKGMHLKSEGFASSLYDPDSAFTLKTYCAEQGLPYSDIGSPVPIEVFTSYGIEFQKRFVPQLEPNKVTSVRRSSSGFEVTADGGEKFSARRVVVAVGLTYFASLPAELENLPVEYVTHSSEHSDVSRFKGREVVVIGGGASALDLAALLHEAGASVQVVARIPKLRFQDPPEEKESSLLDRLQNPVTGIGPGWKLYACANMPLVFRMMPEQFRIEKVRKVLGPAPCWFTKEEIEGKVECVLGVNIESCKVKDGRVKLQVSDNTGKKSALTADHVIAGTGYKYDVGRISFLSPDLISALKCIDRLPALSSNFESSVPNLYFAGITAANTFGPLLRFAFGAGFAAPRLARHLARTAVGKRSLTDAATKAEVAEQVAR